MLTLYDSGGTDTLDFSTDSTDQVINLQAEETSSIYGNKGNLIIAPHTEIENVVAGRGNDAITGNNADNILTGGPGADKLDGGTVLLTGITTLPEAGDFMV